MPPVTSTEPREARPKLTREQRIANSVRTAYANNRKRPYALAADGFPAPTELEIVEGLAHKLMESSKSKMLTEEWNAAFWELAAREGFPATSRCGACHVVKFGRYEGVPCGACGSQEQYVYVTRRYEPPK